MVWKHLFSVEWLAEFTNWNYRIIFNKLHGWTKENFTNHANSLMILVCLYQCEY